MPQFDDPLQKDREMGDDAFWRITRPTRPAPMPAPVSAPRLADISDGPASSNEAESHHAGATDSGSPAGGSNSPRWAAGESRDRAGSSRATPAENASGATEADRDRPASEGFPIPPRPPIPANVIKRPGGFTRQSYSGRGRPPMLREEPPRPELLDRYEPGDSLILSVAVYRWPDRHTFYDQFVKNAHLMHAAQGAECPRVPFFSYIPQYCQLNRLQRAFYLWFRDSARQGTYIDADVSYILLYFYEIINLPDMIPAPEGLRLMTRLYLAYRTAHRELDRYLADWITDYCLLNRLEPPEELRPVFGTVIPHATLKEFFLGRDFLSGDERTLADELMVGGADYDYRTSRWYGQYRTEFDTHIPAAVAAALGELRRRQAGFFAPEGRKTVKTSRDAFCGSLCEHNIKRRIDVEYVSLTRTRELRESVTAMVKYAENQLRARFHLKSRLSVLALPPEAREAIDGYFGAALPSRRPAAAEERPAWEALYDTPAELFSAERARAIEASSWELTEALETAGLEGAGSLGERLAGARNVAPAAEPDGPIDDEMQTDGPSEDPAAWDEGTEDGQTKAEAVMDGQTEAEAVMDRQAKVEASAAMEATKAESAPIESAHGNGAVTEADSAEIDVRQALQAVLSGGSLARFAAERHLFPDDLAGRINEAAWDRIGDGVLESDGRQWVLIEDYRKDVEEWIRQ